MNLSEARVQRSWLDLEVVLHWPRIYKTGTLQTLKKECLGYFFYRQYKISKLAIYHILEQSHGRTLWTWSSPEKLINTLGLWHVIRKTDHRLCKGGKDTNVNLSNKEIFHSVQM